jgi:monovalent cation/proton antiporter MnhG/PhaG subunit
MSPKDVLIDVLLGLGVLTVLVSCVGVLAMPHVWDALHFLTPATSVAPLLLAGAVVAEEAMDHQGILAVLIAMFLLVFNPVLTHATARAARIRRHGQWSARPEETVRRL